MLVQHIISCCPNRNALANLPWRIGHGAHNTVIVQALTNFADFDACNDAPNKRCTVDVSANFMQSAFNMLWLDAQNQHVGLIHRFGITWAVVNPFFFNDTATTEIYTLSLHDALPI